jgi:hypothetical protein
MADLVFVIESGSDRPVVDATGLAGLFSFEVRSYSTMNPNRDARLREEVDDVEHPDAPRPPAEPLKPSRSTILEKEFWIASASCARSRRNDSDRIGGQTNG